MGLLTEISDGKKRPVIEPPGKPPAVVAGGQAGGGDGGESVEALSAPEEKISCSHIRTKKILLIGNFSTGELNWSDVATAMQCVGCGAVFSSGGQ